MQDDTPPVCVHCSHFTCWPRLPTLGNVLGDAYNAHQSMPLGAATAGDQQMGRVKQSSSHFDRSSEASPTPLVRPTAHVLASTHRENAPIDYGVGCNTVILIGWDNAAFLGCSAAEGDWAVISRRASIVEHSFTETISQ